MNRSIHFVGTLPPPLSTSPRQAMEWVLDHAGDHRLVSLPCDLDPDWIIDYLKDLADREAFEIKRDGDFADYDGLRTHGVRRGRRLRPDDVSMRRGKRLREIVEEFRALRAERPDAAGVRLQIGLPNPLDLALFAFIGRPWASVRHLPVFVQAVVDEVADLAAFAGPDVVWQLETPAVLGAMDMVRRVPGGPALAARLTAAQVANLIARFPEDADVILHLCYGDYRHTERFAPRDFGPAVRHLNLLANALRRRGRTLPTVHLPAAYGAHPAPRTEAFYRPLSRLDPEWRLIAGIAAAADPEGGVESLRLFESAAGREAYAVATACGLGRHTPDQAERAVAAMTAAAGA